jgi:glycosyltransferase involved in cell wall biosynthesis
LDRIKIMAQVVVNTRVLAARVTGVQRYTAELLSRWNGNTGRIAPDGACHGLAGHAWEQFVLPRKLQGRLLFSPSGSGPLETRNQIVTIHDTSVFDCPESFSPRYGAWYRFLLPRLAKRARRVITDSHFVKERVVTCLAVDPNKVAVIPIGVDTRFCPEAVSSLDEAVAALKLPSREYILAVGSLEPRKNLPRLFQAWAEVQERVPRDIWLIVVGASGSSRVFGETCLGPLPARTFLAGHVEDRLLPAVYAGAIALAYPSFYEGFGLPPLEAMASGTAVLAGNRSSLPELVQDNGLLVDPFNKAEIAEGIYRLIMDGALRQELRQKGLVRAKQFSWDETARKTLEILQSAAA